MTVSRQEKGRKSLQGKSVALWRKEESRRKLYVTISGKLVRLTEGTGAKEPEVME